MRKTIAAATMILVLGVAGAASRDEQTPEGRAYLGFSFGGERVDPRDFHYGLRLDHDSRFQHENSRALPPLMQLDYTSRGLNEARINGLSVLKQRYRMQQDDGETAAEGAEGAEAGGGEAAAVEEPGFFGKIGNWFSGLFGGDDDEEVAEDETETAEAAADDIPPEEVAEGVFMGYSAVDWGMLAAGALGIGFIASEVVGGEENSDQFVINTGSNAAGGDTGGTDPCADPTSPDCLTSTGNAVTGNVPALPPVGRIPVSEYSPEMRERLEWLDGGTGHMGDLQERSDR